MSVADARMRCTARLLDNELTLTASGDGPQTPDLQAESLPCVHCTALVRYWAVHHFASVNLLRNDASGGLIDCASMD